MISKVVSGGQTGADRAALDLALKRGIPHGGWCPKGRKAEDGAIDARYQLTETPTDEYSQRTEWNVRDSDGTVIFTLSSTLRGGSKQTAEFARQHKKPWIHLHPGIKAPAKALDRFLSEQKIRILNVAGSRQSMEPDIAVFVEKMLTEAIFELP